MPPRSLALALALPAVLAIAASTGCAGDPPSRQLWEWTDAGQNVLYTPFPDRVPANRRHTLRLVEVGGPAPPPTPPVAGAPPPIVVPLGLDARIAELEGLVAADEEALKVLISDPETARTLRDSDALREIGGRLPGLQAELETLRAQRAEAGGDGS